MKVREEAQIRTASITLKDWLQDFELLVKFRLSTFVVFSSLVAYCIAAGSDIRFLPLMVLCYFAVIANGFSRCSKTERIVLIVAFVPMVCAILLSSIILNKYVYNHGKRVPSFYEELSIIDKDPSVSSINILGDSFWEPMWESYFLINKNLFFESPSYYPSTPLNGEYDLVSKVNMAGEHVLIFESSNKIAADISINQKLSHFELLNHSNDFRALVRFGNGWWGDEKDHRWAGAAGKKFTVEIITEAPLDSVSLYMDFSALKSSDRLSISLNKELLSENISNSPFLLNNLKLKKGLNILDFQSLLEPQRANRHDCRMLSYNFKKIHFYVK